MSDTELELLSRRDGPVLHLQLNRPDKGNALSAALVDALAEAVATAAQDDSLRLLVLSGAGRHFCTGFDLSRLDQETDDSLLARFTRVELMLQGVHGAPFTTLALAHGRTMGAGADLFAACDERWIVGEASFAFRAPASGWCWAPPASRAGGAPPRGRLDRVGPADRRRTGLRQRPGHTPHRRASPRWRMRAPAHARRPARSGHAARHPRRHRGGDRRGSAGDAEDLARLVRSAARPGLRERIAAYRAAQHKR
jgi:hypothetical protein